MSRAFVALLAILALFAYSVDAHGWLSSPSPRGQFRSVPRRADEESFMATSVASSNSMTCRDDPEMPRNKWISMTAGTSQSVTFQIGAAHPGDCFFYLTYDGDKPDSQKKWFKIWEKHQCGKYQGSYTHNIPIPSYLPSGSHVIFRWEWYATHIFPVVEFYVQCVDATMTGLASGVLPQPQVKIPGHLPEPSGNRDIGTNNYYWDYDNVAYNTFYTGPPVATPNGNPNYNLGSATAVSYPTVKPPTTAPVIPTTKPVTPTTKPATPTTKPVTTPTTRPKPTSAPNPTTRPTPTIKPSSPTTSPVVTVPSGPILDNPPAAINYVKLVVTESASVWWFSCSVTGDRANEVSKLEIKDSGKITSFNQMTNSWGDVYTYSPGASALVFPLTIKVSLPSGSSLSFTVNRIPGTIDSGSVFP